MLYCRLWIVQLTFFKLTLSNSVLLDQARVAISRRKRSLLTEKYLIKEFSYSTCSISTFIDWWPSDCELFACWVFGMFCCSLLIFFFKINFPKISSTNTNRVPNGLDLDQVLIWVQTICKMLSADGKIASSKERVRY